MHISYVKVRWDSQFSTPVQCLTTHFLCRLNSIASHTASSLITTMDDQLMSCYGLPDNYNNASYGSCMFLNVYNTNIAIIEFQSDDKAEQWQTGYKDAKRAKDWVIMYIESNHVSLTENRTLFANEFLPITVAFSNK